MDLWLKYEKTGGCRHKNDIIWTQNEWFTFSLNLTTSYVTLNLYYQFFNVRNQITIYNHQELNSLPSLLYIAYFICTYFILNLITLI